MLEHFKSRDAAIRVDAARELEHYKDQRAVSALIACLESKNQAEENSYYDADMNYTLVADNSDVVNAPHYAREYSLNRTTDDAGGARSCGKSDADRDQRRG
jgi:HEAT repeat protein